MGGETTCSASTSVIGVIAAYSSFFLVTVFCMSEFDWDLDSSADGAAFETSEVFGLAFAAGAIIEVCSSAFFFSTTDVGSTELLASRVVLPCRDTCIFLFFWTGLV